MTEKHVGYTLLGIGILLMFYSVVQIILSFTGRSQPFDLSLIELSPSTTTSATEVKKVAKPTTATAAYSNISGAGLEGGLSNFGIDQDSLQKMLNLSIYYVLLQVVLGLGYKLATLGVQMVRPLKVEVKRNPLSSSE